MKLIIPEVALLVLRRNKVDGISFLNVYTIYLFVDARLFFTKQCIREFEEKIFNLGI